MRIEIICTGDEVLFGHIINSNSALIARKLEDHGLAVSSAHTLGDETDELIEAFRQLGGTADAVIVTGGLGPTQDDLTRQAAAKAAQVELELDTRWLQRMERMFGLRGREMTENNRVQAMLPRGSEIIDNPIGTACGFGMDIGGTRFFFAPGVPRELDLMLDKEIIPRLKTLSRAKGDPPAVVITKRFNSFGLAESQVDSLLSGLEKTSGECTVKIGYRADYPLLETKLVARAASSPEATRELMAVEHEVRNRLGNYIVSEDGQTLEDVVRELLATQGESLALAEEFTSGHIAGRLGRGGESEAFLTRATVAPSLYELFRAFNLNPERLTPAESTPPPARMFHTGQQAAEQKPHRPAGMLEVAPAPGVARTIAKAARDESGASLGLAVLGTLELEAHQAGHPQPGEESTYSIQLAIATRQKTLTRTARLRGDFERVRMGAVEMALDCLRRHLKGLPLREKTHLEK